ncbi:MAG: hypothetical protein E2O42_04870, partial [Nitrospina sp.]
MSLQAFFYEVISPKRSLYLMPVYGLLRVLAVVYALVQRVRARCYRFKIFQTRRLGCRVISIGNLT